MADHLTGYRATRPVRALVLVPLAEDEPWQLAMLAALRAQAATWGGAANLVVPWTADLFERNELWAIARLLDPDVVAAATGCPNLEPALTLIAQRLPVLQNNGKARPLHARPDGIRFPCTPVSSLDRLEDVAALRCSASHDLELMLAADGSDHGFIPTSDHENSPPR
jgi:hypothetical protein